MSSRCNLRKSVGYFSNALFIVRNLINKKNYTALNNKDKNIHVDIKDNISLKDDGINSTPDWHYLHSNDTKPVTSNSVSNYLIKLEEKILVKLSYVHLCLNNTQTSLMITKELVNNPLRDNLNEQIKFLGEIYYLESLCANGYITDALTAILKQNSKVTDKNNTSSSEILKGCVFSNSMYITTSNYPNNKTKSYVNPDVILMINKASVLSLDGQLDLAYDILTKALEIQPNFVPIIRGLVYIYIRKGELEEALKLLKLYSKGDIRTTRIQHNKVKLDNKINKK